MTTNHSLETRRPVDTTTPTAGTRDTAPCTQCGESVEPGERGPVPTYCPDCRELRHTVNRLQRILDRRPELREVMERELCVKLSKAPRSPGQDRPAWRDRRRDVYLPGSLWVLVQYVAKKGAETPVTYSAALRWIIKSWWKEFAGLRLRVVDGELVGWAEEEREVA